MLHEERCKRCLVKRASLQLDLHQINLILLHMSCSHTNIYYPVHRHITCRANFVCRYHWFPNVNRDGRPQDVLLEIDAELTSKNLTAHYYQLDAYWYKLEIAPACCIIDWTAVSDQASVCASMPRVVGCFHMRLLGNCQP